jgi:DNA-binding NtrC family response regulator
MTSILFEHESSPSDLAPRLVGAPPRSELPLAAVPPRSAAPAESGPSEAPPSSVELRTLKAARREAINRFEIEYVRSVLQKTEGNVTRAAALADVSRQVIHKLIAKHRLSEKSSSGG